MCGLLVVLGVCFVVGCLLFVVCCFLFFVFCFLFFVCFLFVCFLFSFPLFVRWVFVCVIRFILVFSLLFLPGSELGLCSSNNFACWR